MIYLSANNTNLGEVMDLTAIRMHLRRGEVFWLDSAVRDPAYREKVLSAIRGQVPVVAGGGSLMRFFAPFWSAIDPDQKFLFVGTGVCWSYGSHDAIALPTQHIHPRSLFRGPFVPATVDSTRLLPPPGILYGLSKLASPPKHILSVVHPKLVDPASQQAFAENVGLVYGLPVVSCINDVKDQASYQSAALVITSRLHGAVLAAGNDIPCFVLSRDHKIDWFCNLINLPYISLMNPTFQLPAETVRLAVETKAVDCSVAKRRVVDQLNGISTIQHTP